MEIVLNFDKKELVIKEAANVAELFKRLKDLKLNLREWTIVSDVVYSNNDWWYYKPYQTYPWREWKVPPGTITCGGTTVDSGVYCISDRIGDEFTTQYPY